MAVPPVQVWYVKCRGGNIRMYEKGGGLYTREVHALAQAERLRARGADVEVFPGTVSWGPSAVEDPSER